MNLSNWVFQQSLVLGARYFYRQFAKDSKRAGEVNRQVLKQILQENANSEYGEKYTFAAIKTAEQYKQLVPLTGYADYEPYIERIANGEENLLTSAAVKYFGLSSGTTGKQKRVPITAKGQRIISMNMMFLQQGVLFEILPQAKGNGKGLLLMNMVQSSATPGGIPTGSATSGGVHSMQRIMPHFWTSPLAVLQVKDQPTANYLHLLFALNHRDLSYVGAPFPSAVVQLFAVLEEQWQDIVRDIRQGRISSKLPLEPAIRAVLEKQLEPNPARADELQREFAAGMQGIANRVWPKLLYVSCVIGGSFNIYLERLRYYTPSLPIYSAVYGATESLIAVAAGLDDVTYAVTPRPAYYEFIPVGEADLMGPKTYDLDQLKRDELYEVVISNFSGFYRYRIGDVVKVVGTYNQTPVVEFMYRKGQLLNLAGEKTPEPAVQNAVRAAMQACSAVVEDYTIKLDLDGPVGRYRFYLEVAKPEELIGKVTAVRDSLERCMGEANPRYRAGLQANRIAPLDLYLVQRGTFQKIKSELVRRGASNNQVKIPRLLKDEQLLSLLDENTL